MLKSSNISTFLDLELLTLPLKRAKTIFGSNEMKKTYTIIILLLAALNSIAQSTKNFSGKFVNEELGIYLVIDFYKNNVVVPNQEIYGAMPGFLGDYKDGRKWLITDARTNHSDTAAQLDMVNDYGSEDLRAELVIGKDGICTLKQLKGSALKVARNRKWVKLPKQIVFKRK